MDTTAVTQEYVGAARFVDVDANDPPTWYGDMIRRAGSTYKGGRTWAPNIVFLTEKGDYLCSLRGGFNTKAHAINVIREIKATFGRYQATVGEVRVCPGNPV